jgi:hypothetical protein
MPFVPGQRAAVRHSHQTRPPRREALKRNPEIIRKKYIYLTSAILLSAVCAQAGDADKFFAKADKNKDGKVTPQEFAGIVKDQEKATKRFARIDTNQDGVASLDEFKAFYDKGK